jgi:hypothetical protein
VKFRRGFFSGKPRDSLIVLFASALHPAVARFIAAPRDIAIRIRALAPEIKINAANLQLEPVALA